MYLALIAGGIASGKSSVARLLEGLGAIRLDLDVLTHELYEPGSPVLQELAEAFGKDVLAADGTLRRATLGERAFASDEARRRLEAITHPAIMRLLDERIAEAPSDALVIVEVPLLDRVPSLMERADEVVAVVCPLERRCVRACGRGMDADDFYARVSYQPSDDYLVSHADTVIDNAGGPEELSRAVTNWFDSLRERQSLG